MTGKLFIAMSEDSFAAQARGVATGRMRSLSYVLAGVLGALSGFAGGQLTFADFALGTALGLSGFIALAVGGIGSSVGALVGVAILGLLTSLTTHYFGAQYQKTIAIGLLILLLVVRPQGLFGNMRVRQV
jgi:branched-chain amino acid transport system permease protein